MAPEDAEELIAEELIAASLELSREPVFVVGGVSVNRAPTRSSPAGPSLDLEEQYAEALHGSGRLADADRFAIDPVSDEPLREVRRGQLLRAHALHGIQADALATFQRARVELVNGLGMEPVEELQRLQSAVRRTTPMCLVPRRNLAGTERCRGSCCVPVQPADFAQDGIINFGER